MLKSISNIFNVMSGSSSRELASNAAQPNNKDSPNATHELTTHALTDAGWKYEISQAVTHRFTDTAASSMIAPSTSTHFSRSKSRLDLTVTTGKDVHVMFFLHEKIGRGCVQLSRSDKIWHSNVYTRFAFLPVSIDENDVDQSASTTDSLHAIMEKVLVDYFTSSLLSKVISKEFGVPNSAIDVSIESQVETLALDIASKMVRGADISPAPNHIIRALNMSKSQSILPLDHIIVDVVLGPGFLTSQENQNNWALVKPIFGIPAQNYLKSPLSKSNVFRDLDLISLAKTPAPVSIEKKYEHDEPRRQRIMHDIITKERGYLQKLKAYEKTVWYQEVYDKAMESPVSCGFLSSYLAKSRFPSVTELIRTHTKILSELEKFPAITVLDLINVYSTNLKSFQQPYIAYCKAHYATLQAKKSDTPECKEFINKAASKINCNLTRGITVDTLQIAPIQFLPHLLMNLNELVKFTSSDSSDCSQLQMLYMNANSLVQLIDNAGDEEEARHFLFKLDSALSSSGQAVSAGASYICDVHAFLRKPGLTSKEAVSLVLFSNYLLVLERKPVTAPYTTDRSFGIKSSPSKMDLFQEKASEIVRHTYRFIEKVDIDCLNFVGISDREFHIVEDVKNSTVSQSVRKVSMFETEVSDTKEFFLRRLRHAQICRKYDRKHTVGYILAPHRTAHLFAERYSNIEIYYNLVETSQIDSNTRRDALCIISDGKTDLDGVLKKNACLYNSAGVIQINGEGKYNFQFRTTAESDTSSLVVPASEKVRIFTDFDEFKPQFLLTLRNVLLLCGTDIEFYSTERHIQAERYIRAIADSFIKVPSPLARKNTLAMFHIRTQSQRMSRSPSQASHLVHANDGSNMIPSISKKYITSSVHPANEKKSGRTPSVLSRAFSIARSSLFGSLRPTANVGNSNPSSHPALHTVSTIPKHTSQQSLAASFSPSHVGHSFTGGIGLSASGQRLDALTSVSISSNSVATQSFTHSASAHGGRPLPYGMALQHNEARLGATGEIPLSGSNRTPSLMVASEQRIETRGDNYMTRSWRTLTTKVRRSQERNTNHTKERHYVVIKLAEYIEVHGINTEGIYRNHGNSNRLLSELRDKPEFTLTSLHRFQLDEIASALKKLLIDSTPHGILLPEPFKSNMLYMSAHETTDSELVPHFTNICSSMSKPQRKFVYTMLRHWRNITNNFNVNRMSVSGMVTALVPFVFSLVSSTDDIIGRHHDISVTALECLIWNFDVIFAAENEQQVGLVSPTPFLHTANASMVSDEGVLVGHKKKSNRPLSYVPGGSSKELITPALHVELLPTSEETPIHSENSASAETPSMAVETSSKEDRTLHIETALLVGETPITEDLATCVNGNSIISLDADMELNISGILRKKLLADTTMDISTIGQLREEILTIKDRLSQSDSRMFNRPTTLLAQSHSDPSIFPEKTVVGKPTAIQQFTDAIDSEIDLDDEQIECLGRSATLVASQKPCQVHITVDRHADALSNKALTEAMLETIADFHKVHLKSDNTLRGDTLIDVAQPLDIVKSFVEEITQSMSSCGIDMCMSDAELQRIAKDNSGLIAQTRVLKREISGLAALKASLYEELPKEHVLIKPTVQASTATLHIDLQ
ncbi:hypothetical protein BSLG_008800 [Batrachochytrium salamandrivorans]|nr:hypothetical protein BSLG_008800 [Batrachochytrium salamandrivorans]